MQVTKEVEENFNDRLKEVLKLIEEYKIGYEEIGIFGSFARNTYKATSDIDLCIITQERPNRRISGSLREDAELLRVDIVYVTKEYFKHSEEPFARQLRSDYKSLIIANQEGITSAEK